MVLYFYHCDKRIFIILLDSYIIIRYLIEIKEIWLALFKK